MKKSRALAAFICLLWSVQAFSQSSNASLSGTVADATGALIPGVTVMATNNATGVIAEALSNDTGTYRFASLLPGTYTVKAELSGFQTQTFTEVQLGNAAQLRLNFTLQVGTVAQAVEVSVAADQLLLESSSSVGDVLERREVNDLPLVSNNVLDLVQVMAGVYQTTSPIFGANDTKFAGVSAGNVNVQRDGVSVAGQRWPTGLNAGTELHPDLVGEVKMILAPVDAEMGRGSGQVQIQTRSGTNQYHGSGVWNVQNSALDANTWQNNRTINPLTGDAVTPPWRNLHQFTGSIGGPIKQNKTFFFTLYDQKVSKTRTVINPTVLTPCAQRGIFRYYDNWNSGHANTVTVAGGANPTIAVVDRSGNPRPPATNPDGTPHNGILRYASVFGPLTTIPARGDCSDAVVGGAPWDVNRRGFDPTGYVENVLLQFMPPANNYDEVGDGLNTAGFRWLRGLDGSNNLFGIGEPTQRKQLNMKIDHLFNSSHKISGTYSYESTWADNSYENWPDTSEGRVETRPQVLAVNFTSTLSSTIVNEARFGMARSGTNDIPTLYNPRNTELFDLLPRVGSTTYVPYLGAGMGTDQPNFQLNQVVGARGFTPNVSQLDNSPRYTYSDTLSWTTGRHAFKFGGEFRRGSSKSTQSGSFFPNVDSIPGAYGGETFLAPVAGINSANMPGLQGTSASGNVDRMENLLVFLSGSLNRIGQFRFINRPDQAQTAWNDPVTEPYKIRDIHQNEFGAFFKDDWKVNNNLTLNLGIRWDYFGPPWDKNGMAATLKGGGAGLFGISGTDFRSWFSPGATGGSLSELIFFGPNSPNPGVGAYQRDLNNFGPAVGFAFSINDRTTVRGGYQMRYIGGSNATGVEGIIGNPPGSVFYVNAGQFGPYMDLTSVTSSTLPAQPPALPMLPIPLNDRTAGISAYDPDYVNPYIQSLTLSITRNIASNLTLDARYIGTLTRKNFSMVNLNVSNFTTNGLKEAFDAARSGGESALLNQTFNGINLGQGTVGQAGFTGADALRNATAGFPAIRVSLANGNYQAVADALYTLTYPNALNPTLPPSDGAGSVLRVNGFPENFVRLNPQFTTANLQTNGASSNYHSLQLQSTLRPAYGVNLSATYTWSKDLGAGSEGFTDPRFQHDDYSLIRTNRAHVFNSYGTFNLPIGPGQFIGGNSGGFLARLIEGWSTSWILNMATGGPGTLSAANMLYGRGTPDQVRPFDFKTASGVVWEEGALSGNYFGNQLVKVRDPQCSGIASSLQAFCTLQAVADTSGSIILQNPLPGTRGNLGLNTLEFAGTWSLDAAIAKNFQISEGLRGIVRVDANNIFNHPTPGVLGGFAQPPNDGGAQVDINDVNPFGNIPLKGASTPEAPASRQFQLKVRLDF